jgi:TM2 domain-containing membrane protein YozV
MCELWIAYLLWAVGGCGTLGLHRFYMRKFGTGILWLCSGGMCMIGALYDLVTMRRQVAEANFRLGYQNQQAQLAYQFAVSPSAGKEKETVEHAVLRVAKRDGGAVTPGALALECDIGIDKAKESLEKLVNKGHCEMRIRSDGVIVYAFPEFGANAATDYEDI